MKQIRRGIDLTIKWRVILTDPNYNYDNLSLVLTDSRMNHIKINQINITNNNVVTGVFYGKDQKILGPYIATLWKNFGQKGQTCVDRIRAFELCPVAPPDNVVELQDSILWTGVQGESAYQSWLNLGYDGTEEDFINYLRAEFTVNDANKEKLSDLIENISEPKFNELENSLNEQTVKINSDISILNNSLTGLNNKFPNIESSVNDNTSRLELLERIDHNEFIKGEILSETEYSNLTVLDPDKVYLITGTGESVNSGSYDDTELRQLISDLEDKVNNIPEIDLTIQDTSILYNQQNIESILTKTIQELEGLIYKQYRLKYVRQIGLGGNTYISDWINYISNGEYVGKLKNYKITVQTPRLNLYTYRDSEIIIFNTIIFPINSYDILNSLTSIQIYENINNSINIDISSCEIDTYYKQYKNEYYGSKDIVFITFPEDIILPKKTTSYNFRANNTTSFIQILGPQIVLAHKERDNKTANDIIKGVVLSEEEYNSLLELEQDKLYFITGAENNTNS